jgi:tellurium resistance protein TerD
MAPALQRGANVALTQEIPSLTGVVLGVRWNAGAEQALSDNLVAATILCDRDSRAPSERYFVFFNQLSSPDESVTRRSQLLGDDREQIEVDLPDVPPEIARIVVALYINDGPGARRSLGQLRDCSIRVLDRANGQELVRSENLAPALRSETAILLGELYRHTSGWKFKVIGQGYDNGIAGIASDYGVPL